MIVEPPITELEQQKLVYVQDQSLNPLDEAVLAIIKLRDGSISLSEVSSTLAISRENLTQSLERLQQCRLIEKTT
jgi:DNA-binding MarR family transcriptional regulator